jgi:acyl-coenzyme A synthetase/AMP-(fatty) acid ligase
VTLTHLVPTHFVRLLQASEAARSAFSGTSLQTVWHGGGPCSVELKRQMLDWWGDCLVEYYGATEGGAATMITAAEARERPGSVGRALYPSTLLVLDADGRQLPAGETGRVFISRRFGFRYHRAPELSAAADVKRGVFTYGELGHLDAEGYLYLTGRADQVIVTGGVNVGPAEVEAALATCPLVRDVAVTGVPDPEFGERVRAYVELADPLTAGSAAPTLDAWCRSRLAGYKVPREYRFVPAVPRDEAGKVHLSARRAASPGGGGVLK